MVLGFKTTINGKPTNFVGKILTYLTNATSEYAPKKHTIREDKNQRWRVGMPIHFATGVRTSKYRQFASGVCSKVEPIRIIHHPLGVVTVDIAGSFYSHSEEHTDQRLIDLAKDDGFDSVNEFFEYFNKDFTGYIIHF